MKRHDLAWLADILDSAALVRNFATGVTFAKFEDDLMLQLAIIRLLEIIGEAAKNVSDEYKASTADTCKSSLRGAPDMVWSTFGCAAAAGCEVGKTRDLESL